MEEREGFAEALRLLEFFSAEVPAFQGEYEFWSQRLEDKRKAAPPPRPSDGSAPGCGAQAGQADRAHGAGCVAGAVGRRVRMSFEASKKGRRPGRRGLGRGRMVVGLGTGSTSLI